MQIHIIPCGYFIHQLASWQEITREHSKIPKLLDPKCHKYSFPDAPPGSAHTCCSQRGRPWTGLTLLFRPQREDVNTLFCRLDAWRAVVGILCWNEPVILHTYCMCSVCHERRILFCPLLSRCRGEAPCNYPIQGEIPANRSSPHLCFHRVLGFA